MPKYERTGWGYKVFNGKRYKAEHLIPKRWMANNSAKFARKHGALVRILPESGGYRIWMHGSV